MNKKTIILLSILALAIIVFAVNYFYSSSIELNPPVFIKGFVVTEKGTVIENVTKYAPVDGPAYLRVKKEGGILSGSEIKVFYSPGETPCVNPIQSAFSIKSGERVEVHGIAVTDDTISTCESKDYYIKTSVTPPSVILKNESQNNIESCNVISNSSFRSIEQYEVGLGPNGPAMGNWFITFQGNQFEWSYSDISESGTYTCKNNILHVKNYRAITTHYDRTKEILTWDGVEYKKVK